MRFPHARILVFCKPPIPGQAKTRLIPALGAQGAADLHAELARATVATAVQGGLAPVELWASDTPEHMFFQRLHAEFGCAVRLQQGDDLGARMAHAMETTLAAADFTVLIGTDCPGLDADYLARACAALAAGADAVLGPAEDGGYVLIGARRCDPVLFTDMPWGSDQVLARTRARIAGLGWEAVELPPRWDVDRPADLARYLQTVGRRQEPGIPTSC